MDRCVKNFLDTRLYTLLRQAFDVCIVSYLSEDAGFRAAYGGPGVSFLPAPRFRSQLRQRVFNLAEIWRFHGFYFRWRRTLARLHWSAVTGYRYPEDYGPGKRLHPRRARALLFWILAGLGSTLRLFRLVPKLLARWYFDQPALAQWLAQHRPLAYIATAHRTDQEKFLAFHAGRLGVRSVLVPDSWDNFIVDGFQYHEYDAYGVMGAVMAKQLERIHSVGAARQVQLGVPVRRMYEELTARAGYDLRVQFDIPAGVPVITYIAVSTMACYDTVEIVRRLADAIETGRLPAAVILVRTQPGQDPAEYFEKLGSLRSVRIQVAGNRGGGGEGRIDFARRDENLEYAATIRQANAVISNLSACAADGYVAGVPTILNAVELSAYARGGFSPSGVIDLDPFEIVATGVAVARDMDQLIAHVRQALTAPQDMVRAGRAAAAACDYQVADYAERFVAMIGPGST